MIKGKWVILAVLGVALVMGLATWPLLGLRRRLEIGKTKALIQELRAVCDQYRTRHGRYPERLDDLQRGPPLDYLDAWRHPIRYRVETVDGKERTRFWSTGPNLADSSDDFGETPSPKP